MSHDTNLQLLTYTNNTDYITSKNVKHVTVTDLSGTRARVSWRISLKLVISDWYFTMEQLLSELPIPGSIGNYASAVINHNSSNT